MPKSSLRRDDDPIELKTAIMLAKRGSPIPADLALKLSAQGYDTATILKRYS